MQELMIRKHQLCTYIKTSNSGIMIAHCPPVSTSYDNISLSTEAYALYVDSWKSKVRLFVTDTTFLSQKMLYPFLAFSDLLLGHKMSVGL